MVVFSNHGRTPINTDERQSRPPGDRRTGPIRVYLCSSVVESSALSAVAGALDLAPHLRAVQEAAPLGSGL